MGPEELTTEAPTQLIMGSDTTHKSVSLTNVYSEVPSKTFSANDSENQRIFSRFLVH